MRVSFSLSRTPGAQTLITEFDPSPPSSQSLIIPPLHNHFRPFKKTRISQPDPSSVDVEQGSQSISYGLNVMRLNHSNGVSGKAAMEIKYREDMRRLPDHFGFQEFEDVPVEGFGAAVMAGYGWREGRGIGRNANQDVKVLQYRNWNGKEGLGFQKEAPLRGKNDAQIGGET